MLLQNNLFILFIYILVSILLSFLILIFSLVISLKNPDNQKLSAYECGFDPYGDSRMTFNIHFYIVGLIFLIFDLETVFLLPWSYGISFMTSNSFFGILDFIFELLLGFYYIWIIGVLDWK